MSRIYAIIASISVLALFGCGGGDGGNFNSVPIANIGQVQNVPTGSIVTLNGSNSSDVDRDILEYSWSLSSVPAGSIATLSDSSSERPTFIADIEGDYTVRLTVNDGMVDSTAVDATISAVTEIGLIGYYDFDSTATDKMGANDDFYLDNAYLENDSTLFLNGIYDQHPLGFDPSPGYRAWTHLPALDYESFTINLDFKTIDLTEVQTPLTMSHTSRWLILRVTTNGQLLASFNNYTVNIYDLNLPLITATDWHNLNVSYDGQLKEICIALDGTQDCRQLASDFSWTPLVDPANYSVRDYITGQDLYGQYAVDFDKQLLFTNYSSGHAFHGWIDNIKIYDHPFLP